MAFEDLILGFVIVQGKSGRGVHLLHGFGHHVRPRWLYQQTDCGIVHRRLHQHVKGGAGHHRHKQTDDGPFPFHDDADVVAQVHFYRCLDFASLWGCTVHQKKLCGTTIISSGNTGSSKFALMVSSSIPFRRLILIRPVDALSVKPPASVTAFSTVNPSS